jgi:hypothetical protein
MFEKKAGCEETIMGEKKDNGGCEISIKESVDGLRPAGYRFGRVSGRVEVVLMHRLGS